MEFNCKKLSTCRSNKNISTTSHAFQYQTQKIIQNTLRVPSSLYTMNLGALNVYQSSHLWNNMSDRIVPHVQKITTTTHLRPGSLSPGGVGVDIKYNSYNRYLAKLKARGPLRRENIPSTFDYQGFNRASPIYGGKLFKTAIGSTSTLCNCNYDSKKKQKEKDLYTDKLLVPLNNVMFGDGYDNATNCTCLPNQQNHVYNQLYGYTNTNSQITQCQFNFSNGKTIYIL